MAPTEADVLTNHLIRPASLDAILTFESFAERFPASQRDGPQVRLLWKDLVAQRERVLDEVRANIDIEVKRGQAMRREVLRAKREAAREEPDGEVEMERAVRFVF
jgi:centromere-localized protein 2